MIHIPTPGEIVPVLSVKPAIAVSLTLAASLAHFQVPTDQCVEVCKREVQNKSFHWDTIRFENLEFDSPGCYEVNLPAPTPDPNQLLL